jgi:hypothetical protein
MAKFLKIYSVILFFNVSLFFLAMIAGAMRDGGAALLFLILIIGYSIVLTLYYVAVFAERVDRAEERVNKFFDPHSKRKYENEGECLMVNIASIVFITLGIVFIIVALACLSAGNLFMVSMIIVAIGLAQISLGISMRKLARIEDRLSKYIFLPDEDKYPEVVCERCGREYDVNATECPYCKIEKMKEISSNSGRR